MEKLKKISKVMNVVFMLVLLIAVANFVRDLVNLSTNHVALYIEKRGAHILRVSSMDIGAYVWHFENGLSVDTDYLRKGIIIDFFASLLELVMNVFLVCTFRELFKPMMHGEPYGGTVSRTLRKLGVACILICIVGNVISYLQAIIASNTINEIGRIFLSEVVKGIEYRFSFKLGSLLIGVLILVFSLVFKYGEELQVQADETL